MNTPSLRLKARSGEKLLGVLLRMPNEELIEMSAVAGTDFVVVDGEHGPADGVALRQHIATAAAYGIATIVRVGEGDHGSILRALDQGAQGVLVPHLDTPADANATVQATHYPPVGRRGFATYNRAGLFGTVDRESHRVRLSDETLLIGMIESPAGVAAVAAIAATRGIDGLMIGPSDLAAATGPDDVPVAEATREVHRAVAEAGILRMDIVGTRDAASAAFSAGASLVVYNLTDVLMRSLSDVLSAPR
jgi:4-hydroxy-2-oxoheptanedioate aldolase